jgi:hypothetical protein
MIGKSRSEKSGDQSIIGGHVNRVRQIHGQTSNRISPVAIALPKAKISLSRGVFRKAVFSLAQPKT